MQEKKKKIIILSIAIVAVIAIIAGSTYAYWQITKTQETPNDIVAACLDITMENETGTFGLDKAWPISDSEGEALTGYTFEVKNNCSETVNYIIGLNSVIGDSDNYLDYSSLRLKLDDEKSSLISKFGDIEYNDLNNTEIIRDSKLLSTESLEGKGTATHNVKVWIDEDAPVIEQGKIFRGQIFITGGQGLPIQKECFAINTEGTILSYDYSCGTDVAVPATIAGIEVKKIDESSFLIGNIQIYSLYNEETDEGKEIYYITDENVADDIVNLLKQDICEDPTTCTLEDIDVMGLKVITTEEEYNAIDWAGYEASGYTIEGPYVSNFNSATGEFEEPVPQVTSLDLSEAVYLEAIGEYAFYGKRYYESDGDCEGEKIFFDTSGGNYCVKGLEKLILPENGALTTIGENAFANNKLTSLNIPSGVREIGDSAFASNLIKNIDFPESVEIIEYGAFEKNEITQLDISVPNIGSSAFNYNKLTKVTIRSEVENIGDGSFAKNQITTLIFEDTEENPSQLTTIESVAFYDNRITELTIPSSVTTIGNQAFASNNISGILAIPNSVLSIGYSAFSQNFNLSNIIIKRTEADALANMTFGISWNGSATITYNPNYIE